MRALVTGATGFIGSHLAEALVKKGYEVSCLVRKTSDTKWLGSVSVNFVYGDLRSGEGLNAVVQDSDYIFHCAGLVKAKSFAEYMEGNYLGSKNIIEATARRARNLKRFVHISSLSVTGPALLDKPATEDSPLNPVSEYGRSKMEAEKIVTSFRGKIPITIIRPPAVYGPRDTGVYNFFKIASFGLAPYLGSPKYFCLVHSDDLVRGIILSAESEKAQGEIYFIADNGFYRFDDLMQKIAKAVGRADAWRVRVPEKLLYAMACGIEGLLRLFGKHTFFNREKVSEIAHRHWICSNEKAKRELAFRQEVSIENGLAKTAEWYKKTGWLR